MVVRLSWTLAILPLALGDEPIRSWRLLELHAGSFTLQLLKTLAERWGSGQDGCSRERGHQSVEAVVGAIWCRREWHASVHGGEHHPVSQKLRLVVHRCVSVVKLVRPRTQDLSRLVRQGRRNTIGNQQFDPSLHMVQRTVMMHQGDVVRRSGQGILGARCICGHSEHVGQLSGSGRGVCNTAEEVAHSVRESQASTVVAVELSEPSLCFVPRGAS